MDWEQYLDKKAFNFQFPINQLIWPEDIEGNFMIKSLWKEMRALWFSHDFFFCLVSSNNTPPGLQHYFSHLAKMICCLTFPCFSPLVVCIVHWPIKNRGIQWPFQTETVGKLLKGYMEPGLPFSTFILFPRWRGMRLCLLVPLSSFEMISCIYPLVQVYALNHRYFKVQWSWRRCSV